MYDPADPRVYFGIGDAVAAIAVIVAFSALTKPIHRFRLRTRRLTELRLYSLLVGALSLVFVAAILPLSPYQSIWYFGYPILWEALAGALFTGLSVALIWISQSRVVFGRHNHERFLWNSYALLAEGREEAIGAFAVELRASMRPVVRCIKGYRRHGAHGARERGEEYEIAPETRSALALLDWLSDRKFCKEVVTHAPLSAIEFFRNVTMERCYDSGGVLFGTNLISEAFRDPGSILYREGRYEGLGGNPLFTHAVFGDYRLIDSEFRPLQAASLPDDVVQREEAIRKYSDVLQVALGAYFDADGHRSYQADAVHMGLTKLSDFAMSEVYRLLDDALDRDTVDKLFGSLHACSKALGEVISLFNRRCADLVIPEFEGVDSTGYEDRSAAGILADVVFVMLQSLSILRSRDRALRHVAFGFWQKLYPFGERESAFLRSVHQRLEARIAPHIEANLVAHASYYPVMIRLLINIIGLAQMQDGDRNARSIDRLVAGTLRSHFPTTATIGGNRIAEALPDDYSFDAERVVIVQDRGKHSPWTLSLSPAAA